MVSPTPHQPVDIQIPDVARMLLDEALAPVSDDLRALNQVIASYLPAETASSQQIIGHIFKAGGKRIRPAMFFMCCRLLGYQEKHYFPIAAVSEFIHTASLLHDDVIDNSSLRRNKPTANSIWGDEASVLVGDLIYSTASEMMAATGNMEIVKTFARAIRLMSEGELLQLESLFAADLSEKTYFRILECKTATLIAASCRAAGLLAGASDVQCQALSQFGHSVGLAFQLIDDALDYTGSAALVGKETLADLAEGKITLPVILLREYATPAELERLRQILAQTTIERSAIEEVASLVMHYDTALKTVERAESYTEKAMQALKSFPATPARDILENLANKMLYRFT